MKITFDEALLCTSFLCILSFHSQNNNLRGITWPFFSYGETESLGIQGERTLETTCPGLYPASDTSCVVFGQWVLFSVSPININNESSNSAYFQGLLWGLNRAHVFKGLQPRLVDKKHLINASSCCWGSVRQGSTVVWNTDSGVRHPWFESQLPQLTVWTWVSCLFS